MIQKLPDCADVVSSTALLKSPSQHSDLELDSPELEFTGKWISDTDQMKAQVEQWRRLSETAVRTNFCFEPSFLIPAFEHLNEVDAKLLVIEAPQMADPTAAKVWCAVIPVMPKKIYHLPFTALEIWKHDQCFDCTPLLRKDCAEDALRFAFQFLRSEGVSLLSADTVASGDGFGEMWSSVVEEVAASVFVREEFDRACFRPMDNHEDYIVKHVSKSIRKNTRRLSRRLEDEGEVEVVVSDASSDYEQLIQQFLEIEASGWKRESGTALVCKRSTKAFFESMVTASAEAGRVRFLSLNLDGKPVSILCDLYSPRHGFSYKTGFDDSYSAFSPGLLAEMFNLEKMHGYGIEYVDSCTEPDNNTMNRIWGHRLGFSKSIISLKSGLSALAVKTLPAVKKLAKRLKRDGEAK